MPRLILAPLEILDNQEGNPQENRRQLQVRGRNFLSLFQGRYRQSHGEAAGQKDEGVDRPQDDVLFGSGPMKILGVIVAKYGIKEEYAAEKEDFGEEEEPHPHLFTHMIDVPGCRAQCFTSSSS